MGYMWPPSVGSPAHEPVGELTIPATDRELIVGNGLTRRSFWGIPKDEARCGGDWPGWQIYRRNADDDAADAAYRALVAR